MVGCVIVHEGEIIGEGWHRQWGGPHAEVNAVRDAERRGHESLLRASTLYVSLEPCSHWGKTPPCAELIIEKQIPRVVVGCVDSYCEVSGRGIARMREAGIDVQVGLLEKECLALNRRFFTAQNSGRPYVVLKWAQTRDGYLDAERPSSAIRPVWMTGPAARILVHKWRAEEDAILVGRRTAELDDPGLTVRDWVGPNPLRVVLDRQRQLPMSLRLFDGAADTVVFCAPGQPTDSDRPHLTVEPCGDLPGILRTLREKYRVQSLLVEGGAEILNAFIEEGLWDEARVFTSPLGLGELYPAAQVPHPVGIPAPILPGHSRITGDIPALGLTLYSRSGL